MKDKKLAIASQVYTNLQPNIVPGLAEDPSNPRVLPYKDSIKACRFFYRRDPIASTVVNRLAEIATTQLVNKHVSLYGNTEIPDSVFDVYNSVARIIQPYIKNIILSYLIDGMAVPQYELVKSMGNRLSNKLGRTRYTIPQGIWLRSAEHIQLKTTFMGGIPRAYLQIPQDDIIFVQNKGVWANGKRDIESYNLMREKFPEYIALIQSGETLVPFNEYIIFRNLLPGNTYPIPFLEAALEPLNHKRYLKTMDKAIASRAIEAFRHVKVGSDEFPADDDDIRATQDALNQKSAVDRVYNLFTNHTIDISWVVPPFDALLNDAKYTEANADIFFALGFPRILTVGETEKSNSADNKIASLGVLSSIRHIQSDIIEWVKHLYNVIAVENGFTNVPTPAFTDVQLADVTQLLQYAAELINLQVISKDTVAAIYGTTYDSERIQIEYEQSLEPDQPIADQVTTQTEVPDERMGSAPEQPQQV